MANIANSTDSNSILKKDLIARICRHYTEIGAYDHVPAMLKDANVNLQLKKLIGALESASIACMADASSELDEEKSWKSTHWCSHGMDCFSMDCEYKHPSGHDWQNALTRYNAEKPCRYGRFCRKQATCGFSHTSPK